MRYLLGIALGCLSGLLIYMIAAMLFWTGAGTPYPSFVLGWWSGGWAASSVIFIRGTKTAWGAVKRGTLIGAAEWIAVIPAGLMMAGRGMSSSDPTTSAGAVGAATGAGVVSFVTGGVAIAMAFVCLMAFAVAHFLQKEMDAEA